MKNTTISWANHTFNPWKGCTRVSGACDNCYAALLAERRGWAEWGPGKPRVRAKPKHWEEPLQWNREIEQRGGENERVFCLSMGDIFDTEVDQAWRDEVFELVGQTPHLNWLLLTKRAREAVKYADRINWPENAWIGTTVETQDYVWRAEAIKAIPAPVRFLSMEPLLGKVDVDLDGIDWVIAGGESGPNFRSMPKAWVLDIQRQCAEAKVPFFFKQWAAFLPDGRGHELNSEVCHALPTPVKRERPVKPGTAAENQAEVIALAE